MDLSLSFIHSLNIHCGSTFVPVTVILWIKDEDIDRTEQQVLTQIIAQWGISTRTELLKNNIKRIMEVESHLVMGVQGSSPMVL